MFISYLFSSCDSVCLQLFIHLILPILLSVFTLSCFANTSGLYLIQVVHQIIALSSLFPWSVESADFGAEDISPVPLTGTFWSPAFWLVNRDDQGDNVRLGASNLLIAQIVAFETIHLKVYDAIFA